ncbi:patatin-like phospholipase family protein [Lysobacter hankyongensis]|uniref:Patatin-like phospholipase family protein n=1 Tax=Lysobacter hankyongensis TaxID=1176535 RepID=A0ABP9BUR6_9GAMM
MTSLRFAFLAFALTLTAGCGGPPVRPNPPAPVAKPAVPTPPVKIRIGLALGGGAAKGFAHIGVIKMLEANGFKPEVVSGTSAGSVVGALYASGMDVFQLQEHAVSLDEARIRDVALFNGGLVRGQKLQDYVNEMVGNRPFEKMKKPFAAVSTRLETGERTVFNRGNVGQAVRASCSIPGVFEPVKIGDGYYIDGGVVSPVPVDAARQLGADFVIAVDISTKTTGKTPESMLGVVNQSITIMGQKLGEQELARADIVIRPRVNDVGPADFERRNAVILEGEKAALAALPQIRAKLAQMRVARAAAQAAKRNPPPPLPEKCEEPGLIGGLLGQERKCKPRGN